MSNINETLRRRVVGPITNLLLLNVETTAAILLRQGAALTGVITRAVDQARQLAETDGLQNAVRSQKKYLQGVAEQLTAEREKVDRRLQETDDPQDLALAVGRLGHGYHAYDLWNAAEVCYRKAIHWDPSDPQWPYALSHVLEKQGELEEAARSLERVISLQPDHRLAYIRLGRARFDLGAVEAAA